MTEKQPNNRYFLVFYHAKRVDGSSDYGNNVIITKSGKYANYNDAIAFILSSDSNRIAAIITNIIELSEFDYNEWSRNLDNF